MRSGHPLLSCGNTNTMIGVADVDLGGEVFSTAEMVEGLLMSGSGYFFLVVTELRFR